MKFLVTGMTCENCVRHVREAIEEIPGTLAVDVDLASGRVTVEGAASPTAIIDAIEEEGYSAQVE